jgi:ubiquitin-like domain-containing CTD phosphatase 1
MKHDERMRLIELSRHEFSAWDPQHLRYRSDHDQRTIMSGQVFLRGLFDEEVQAYFTDTGNYPTIPLHIADRARDILGPNPKVCPRLKDIADRAEKSEEYQAFNNSEETQSIREFMKEEVGDMNQDKILDCLMTAICTDRDLPEPLGDFGKEDSWFQKLAEYDIQSYNKVLKYNDSGM